MPAGFWDRADVHAALADRDFGALFALVRRWAGASQYRIAEACGLSQGRVSKIINREQRVEKLDPMTRIADGLNMPDHARFLVGLAPGAANATHPEPHRVASVAGTAAPAHGSGASTAYRDVDDLRQDLDRVLASSSGVTASQVEGFEEAARSSARMCVFEPPVDMIARLRLDITEVRDLIPRSSRPPLQQGLYAIIAMLGALMADEFMVIGDTRQSRSWYATARFAADQSGDVALRSHVRALAALLPLYYGAPAEVVALTDQSITLAQDCPGVHLALAHTYRALALAQLSATDESLASFESARSRVEDLADNDREDSVFAFSNGRWRFYQGRILSYLGRVDQAWAIHDEALASYPPTVVGDITMIYFDRAISFVRSRDLQRGIGLASRAFCELPAEHRTDLFVRTARRVVAAVAPADRDTQPVREFRSLLYTTDGPVTAT